MMDAGTTGASSHDGRSHAALDSFKLELPTWGFSNTGTRFAVFAQPGTPRDVWERIDDASTVHRFTGCSPLVSLHIPWDAVDDFGALRSYVEERGLRVGGINSNTFQGETYRLGSLAHPETGIQRKALLHLEECCRIVSQTGSTALKVWLGDGSNYPGQDDFRRRRRSLQTNLREVHGMLPRETTLLVEYKPYEPALYHTDIPDWGAAALLCRYAGDRAKVVVDLGHHLHGVNIEQIVATLLDEGLLGAFDLNDRKYGDDDLMAGSINPFQLFLVFAEIASVTGAVGAGSSSNGLSEIRFMVDQAHNIEARIPAMILTVMTLQESWLKAHLVDRVALAEAQATGDVIAGFQCMKTAFDTDVRPLIGAWRKRAGLAVDPLVAYLNSGEAEARVQSRSEGQGAGWR